MKQSLLNRLKAQPASEEPLTDEKEIKRSYAYWRFRTLYSLFIGYAVFYFVRKNLSAATPALLEDLSLTKTQVGALWSFLYLAYGLSKFVNGILADRANPRYFMAFGLFLSALCNIFFGLASSIWVLGIFWTLNGWVQGMGWPPCARSLTHWWSVKERGTFWGLWNASHQVGGAIILIVSGWLAMEYGWRYSFFVPAIFAVFIAFFLANRLRDTPESLGLPAIEDYKEESKDSTKEAALPWKEILFKHVLTNKYIWFLSIGNFFVYIVRYGAMDWAPTYLVEVKGSNIASAGFQVAGFELTGILGAFAAGWLSDKIFKGRRGPINFMFMLVLIGAVLLFWWNPPDKPWIDALTLAAVGFLVYGPQMLVGVAAADIAGKKASATATGLTGLLGYMGSLVSGVGVGWVVDNYGWDGGFGFIVACAATGTILFALTWKVRGPTA